MTLILVIDDETELVEDICTILELQGYEAVGAANGQEALDRIKQQTPDLILSDIRMPIMNGYELLSLLRANEAYNRIPVIFFSATTAMADARETGPLQPDAFISKPAQIDELLESVRALLP